MGNMMRHKRSFKTRPRKRGRLCGAPGAGPEEHGRSRRLKRKAYGGFIILLMMMGGMISSPVRGEVVTDGTVGRAGEISGPRYNISADLGSRMGDNLFHSFSIFNIGENESARFSGADSIRNVIARVTGGNESLIDGKLSCDIPGSDLYLLNPSGIIFGENASLDIQGSFHTATSDYLRLGEDIFYTGGIESELLSSEPPSAFGFLNDSPASVVIRSGRGKDGTGAGKGLSVKKGETVSIIGGDIVFERGARVTAPGGRILVAGVKSPGEVAPSPFGLMVGSEIGGTVLLKENSRLDVSGDPAGNIYIRGGLVVLDKAELRSENLGPGEGWENDDSGDIPDEGDSEEGDSGDDDLEEGDSELDDSGDDDLEEGDSELDDSGDDDLEEGDSELDDSGDDDLEEGDSELDDSGDDDLEEEGLDGNDSGSDDFDEGSSEQSDSDGKASGEGDLGKEDSENLLEWGQVEISERLNDDNEDPPGNETEWELPDDETGDGKDDFEGFPWQIEIHADSLELNNGSRITSGTGGSGGAGSIGIFANHSVRLSGGSAVSTASRGEGKAGFILLEAPEILLDGASGITSESFMTDVGGDAGNIEIENCETLRIENGSTISTGTRGQGFAGSILVEAGEILLSGDSSISSTSSSEGISANAGFIQIEGADSIRIHGGSTITTSSFGTGSAGYIFLNTGTLDITGGSSIASTNVSGTGGDLPPFFPPELGVDFEVPEGADEPGYIGIEAADHIVMDSGSRISTSTSGTGIAGSIELFTERLELRGGASILSSSTAEADGGSAGIIFIKAGNEVSLRDGSSVVTEAVSGGMGLIEIHGEHLVEIDGSRVATDVKSGTGPSGDITVESELVVVNRGEITAKADMGAGGNIFIGSDIYLQSTDSTVTASSRLGISGEVEIESFVPELSIWMPLLSPAFLGVGDWARTPCHVRSGEKISSLVVLSHDGAPLDPGDWQPSPFLNPSRSTGIGDNPVEALGIVPIWGDPCECGDEARVSEGRN